MCREDGKRGAIQLPGRLAPERISRIAQVLADETRRQLLKLMVETRTPLSASKAARALAVETQRVTYQFKALESAHLVFLADTRPVRGVREKLFLATDATIADPIVRALLDPTELWPELARLTVSEGLAAQGSTGRDSS